MLKVAAILGLCFAQCLFGGGVVSAMDLDEVNVLIEQLLSQNFQQSNQAADALVELGDAAVDKLGQTMGREPDRIKRLKLVNVLKGIGSEGAINYLIQALSDPENIVRETATRALSAHAGVVKPRLFMMLLDNVYRTRVTAYDMLLTLGETSDQITDFLLEQLQDSEDINVRKKCLWVLREMGRDARSSVTSLLDMLANEQEEPVIRNAILETLHTVEASAVQLVNWAKALNSETIRNSERLFWLANDYLIAAGDQAIPVIKPLLLDKDPEVRVFVINVLGALAHDDSEARGLLVEAKKDSCSYVSQAASLALGEKVSLDTISPDADPVRISEQGTQIVLDNGVVRLGIVKSTGVVGSLSAYGTDLLGTKGRIYYDTITTPGGTWWPTPEGYQIMRNDGQIAHVAFYKRATQQQPLAVTLNFIVLKGSSGFYFYVTYEHELEQTVDFGQARHVIRFNTNELQYMAISDTKIGRMPTDELFANGESVMDATNRLGDGSVYSKYNWQVFEGEHLLHGIMGEQIGLWMMSASKEYYNGGPFKQNRTVHHGDVLLQIMQSGHFGAGGQRIAADEDWAKIYGPHFIYINQGENIAKMWTDAKLHAEAERLKWPYVWVDEDLYPLERATVTGSLIITDGSSAANGWVILGAAAPHWQHQGKDYLYYGQTDEYGNFSIPHVRGGNYTLWAYVPGVVGELELPVTVPEAGTFDVGALSWTPVKYGELAWRIGIPDRSGAEFFIAGNDYRNWGLWLEYYKNFPQGVVYKVGTSDYTTDWNHYQPIVVATKSGEVSAQPWEVVFDLKSVPMQTSYLTIGIAASTENNLLLELNGHKLGLISRANDNAIYRSSIRGIYSDRVFKVEPQQLVAGENRLTLTVTGNKAAHRGIIYDFIQLEIE